VVARLGERRTGLRALFLADYATNPLGTRSPADVHAALDRWVDLAVGRAPLLVIACNTASVRLQDLPQVAERARGLGVAVRSMVDLFRSALEREPRIFQDRRVCLMGTRFTVAHPLYAEMVRGAGAGEVLPLPATATEAEIAHLRHESRSGRERVRQEVGSAIAAGDAVLLACTCFPLVERLLRDINPTARFLDPGTGIGALAPLGAGEGENRLRVALTGGAVSVADARAWAPRLFPGWTVEDVSRWEGPELRPLPSAGLLDGGRACR
jgi:glutamate racemase